ncbi:alcohol dehydrogenase catalytic domain-containing protein [Nakamurella endophytica]|uniref:Zn-containing dehydrogenase n=1 Tax=Nakamurella endophytica TaxID=1748367 RepID=A0A917WEB4_9ACTN|nr:zinc-binding dehydrogenase [Nakamurella endophytica]GGL97611.1 Zn-containing dehydrogenase [Nakamurella endophytica]
MRISEVVAPRTSVVREVADPDPGPDEVLVDVLACGVCTSDLRPWQRGGTPEKPVRLGHEIVGRVVRLGAQDIGVPVGALVTGLGSPGFATRMLMQRTAVTPVASGIDPLLSIGEPLACLKEAIDRSGTRPGDRVGVVGLGFMGLACVQLLRHEMPVEIVGVDPSAAARRHGLRNGCDRVFQPENLPEELVADDLPSTDDRRLDLVLEATGSTPGLELAGRLVRPYGRLCVVGYHHAGTAKFDMRLWYKGATVVNGFSPDRRRTMVAMRAALALVADGSVDYRPLLTHRFGLDQVDAAYALMENRPDDFVKSVVVLGS